MVKAELSTNEIVACIHAAGESVDVEAMLQWHAYTGDPNLKMKVFMGAVARALALVPMGYRVEERIRELASSKWDLAGRPPGDGLAFWLQAEKEITKVKVKEET